MGLFDRVKKQLLKVIEWEDDSKDTIVYRFPVDDRYAIMNSSTLVVRPSQVALFVHKGQICDVFAPGTYKLCTENIPIITKILALPTAGENPITAEVYYVNTKQITGSKWGTQNPIMMRDKDFGNVRIRAFGVYNFKVENAKKFMEEVFGTNSKYTRSDLVDFVKPMIVQGFTDAVAESKISALDLAANYKEFSQEIINASETEFSNFGLKLTSIVIENISLPAEVEKALDERTNMGIMSDMMGTYTQYQAANAMREAANNPNGNNFAGMGVGLGAGVQMGRVFGDALSTAQDKPRQQQPEQTTEGKKECPNCHAMIGLGVKFCPECGTAQPTKKFCSECGAEVKEGAKFCAECGAKL